MHKTDRPSLDQQGFASIVIALVMILVLALLTVGFAELARREQQNSLDKQLASQAYYAAESGANDMTHLIRLALTNAGNLAYHPSLADLTAVDPTKCLESQSVPNLPSNVINATSDIEYTCTLLDLQPPSLLKSPMDANTAWDSTFSTAESAPGPGYPLSKLTINWQSVGGLGARATGGFSSVGTWNSMAVLQVSITPLGALNRPALLSNTYTAYLYPASSGAGTADYSPNGSINQAPVVNASGCASGTCSVTIDNLSNFGGTPGEPYLVTILDYYDNSTVSVTNAQDSHNNQLNFANGQALIDVTGKDKDVLKRIQVHVPINPAGNLPDYALQAQNICKRLDTAPVIAATNPNGTTYESAGTSATPSTLFDGNDPCSFNGDISAH